jgi:ferredoxin
MRKALLVGTLSIAVALSLSGIALAFHDGGVAYCGGCHTMHNSQDGQPVDPNAPNGNSWLLKDETPSDVCLSCHTQTGTTSNGRYVLSANMLAPQSEQGAGDFVFLLEDNLNDGHNGHLTANFIPGYKGGHSIVAPSKNLAADPTFTMGPGGSFPSSILGCTSCHDPHGNEHMRLLNTTGPIQDGLYTFTNPAPEAAGISTSSAESNANHTAYQGGMSEWCSNCHADFHNSTHNLHPSGSTLTGEEATRYGIYAGTANQNGGDPTASYLAMVPFEDPAMTITSAGGPTANSKVMCLTCHRAHATTGPDIGRWDFKITVWSEEGVESGSWAMPNPYAGSGADQRSLCNKCHNKDEGDELNP